MINKISLTTGFEEIKAVYEGPYLLDNIRKFFESYCLKKTKNVKRSRGMLLYGPPGTGKASVLIGLNMMKLSPLPNNQFQVLQ